MRSAVVSVGSAITDSPMMGVDYGQRVCYTIDMTTNKQREQDAATVTIRHNGRTGTLVNVSSDEIAPTATVLVNGHANVLPASDVICDGCGDSVDACRRAVVAERRHDTRTAQVSIAMQGNERR